MTSRQIGKFKANKQAFKGKRSCQNCQRSKQRCDIERETIRPGSQPQPAHLACHRCKVLRLSCHFSLPPDDGTSQSADSGGIIIERRPSNVTVEKDRFHWSSKTTSSIHSSTSAAQGEGEEEERIHVFDPHFDTDGFDKVKSNGYLINCVDSGSAKLIKSWQNLEIQDRLQSLRPYSYLHRLCSLQPDFFANNSTDDAVTTSLEVILDRHASSIDWQVMEDHLQHYHFFLPFLQGFQSHLDIKGGEQLYLATKIYLVALQTDLIELIADLHLLLRREVVSCILRGPSSLGEASALVALSIYEPLMAARSVQEMQLDGSGLLAAAFTALRTLNVERVPNMMEQYTLPAQHNDDPSYLLTQSSLWITAAFICGFNTLAGNVMQRPLLQCTLQDINHVESFCQYLSSLSSSEAAPWRHQLSYLKVLVFRHRSLLNFHDIIKIHLSMLDQVATPSFGPAEATLVEGVSKSFTFAKETLHKMQSLGPTLSLPAHTCNMLMDYVEFETEQLHTFCIIHFTEACLMRIAMHYGRPIDLLTLADRITKDKYASHFANAVINVNKRDMSRRLTTLFSNFVSRWSMQQSISIEHRHIPLALPPVHITAMMLTNVKTMADFIGGYAHIGMNPEDCLDDCDAGMTVCLCRSHADALRGFSNHNKQLYQAKGHRDYYQMTADIALRTANAIHEWAATKKGLRRSQQTSKDPRHQSTPLIDVANPDIMQMISDTQGQDFEHLLEQILSTPISFA